MRFDLTIPFVLAESSGAVGVIGWSLVLLVLLIGGAAGVMRLRRWMKEDDEPAPGIGFTLSDLRQFHRQGKMTAEEFEKAKAMMLGSAKKMTESMPHPLARPSREGGREPGREPGRDQTGRTVASADGPQVTPHLPANPAPRAAPQIGQPRPKPPSALDGGGQ
jgi:hypothetical protein